MGGNQSSPAGNAGSGGPSNQNPALDATINAVAAQVFDNVHSQLGDLEKAQLSQTEAMASTLKSKLDSHSSEVIDTSICKAQTDALVACLEKNQKSPLECGKLVEAFSNCSLSQK
jgi:hypothetical protein